MKRADDIATPGLFLDIGQSSLKAVNDGEPFEFPIERGENGRLTDLCRERLTASLRGFLGKKGGPANRQAWCAIGARGVSLRRLTLPATSKEDFQRVLHLQIESEFPLSPDELAWGWRQVDPSKKSNNGGPALHEVLVVAVKKEMLQEYAGILTGCGAVPLFTLAALARAEIQPATPGRCTVLDIGRTHSELTTFDNGVPASIRMLPWGGEDITRAIAAKLGVGHDEAEKLKLALNQPATAFGPQGLLLQSAVDSALATLAGAIKPALAGGKIYLTGKTARDPRLASSLSGALGNGAQCESLELEDDAEVKLTAGAGVPAQAFPPRAKPAAIAGLMKSTARNSACSPLILELNGGHVVVRPSRPLVWKWAAAAVALALAALLFPYAEAIVMKPIVEKKLAALQADRGRLATIDQELEFLKFIKQTNLPCLDTIYLLAKSAPQGTHLDGLSMGRHEQVTIRLKLGSPEQLTEFRAKLIESGWFTNVVVEDQTPSPDRRVTVRMTADLNPVELRKPLPSEPVSKKSGKSSEGGAEPSAMMPPPEPMVAASPQSPSPPEMAPASPSDGPDASPPRGGRRGRRGSPQPEQ